MNDIFRRGNKNRAKIQFIMFSLCFHPSDKLDSFRITIADCIR